MRILQVNNFHYIRGGADKIYLETCRLLEEKRHTVIHFSTKDKRNEPSPYTQYFADPIEYFDTKSWSRTLSTFGRYLFNRRAAEKLSVLIEDTQPEIAHLHIFQSRFSSAILPVLRKSRIPTVMTIHEYMLLCPVYTCINGNGEPCERCAKGNYLSCIVGKCHRGRWSYSAAAALEAWSTHAFLPWEKYVDQFILPSDFSLKMHLQYRPVIKRKAQIISNFTDVEARVPSETHEGYFLYFGRLTREKGLLTLLQAWKNLADVPLKIAGQGQMEPFLKRLVEEYKLKNVELLGFQAGQALEGIIRKARFTILPAEWYENNPLSIIESLALGKPVVGAAVGGIPELVRQGETGFLFESRHVEALVEAVKQAEALSLQDYKNMCGEARRFAEQNFSKEAYYRRLMAVYKHLLQP